MSQNTDHKCGECKTYHSSQPSAQVKNMWRFTPFPTILSQCGSKNTDSSTFCCIIKFPYTKVGRNCSHQSTTHTHTLNHVLLIYCNSIFRNKDIIYTLLKLTF